MPHFSWRTNTNQSQLLYSSVSTPVLHLHWPPPAHVSLIKIKSQLEKAFAKIAQFLPRGSQLHEQQCGETPHSKGRGCKHSPYPATQKLLPNPALLPQASLWTCKHQHCSFYWWKQRRTAKICLSANGLNKNSGCEPQNCLQKPCLQKTWVAEGSLLSWALNLFPPTTWCLIHRLCSFSNILQPKM